MTKLLYGMPEELLESTEEIKVESEFDFSGIKLAYPNIEDMNVPGQYDTSKWIQSIKDYYFLKSKGMEDKLAFDRVTQGFNTVERLNFSSWFKFYQGNNHLKYKRAQNWYQSGEPGYFLHIKKDEKEQVLPSFNDVQDANDLDGLSPKEKKQIIEHQRKKLIGRLDSVEKLLRSDEGQLLSGNEFDSMIGAIYDLKKKINKLNKKTSSMKTYEDMLVCTANKLKVKGFNKAASAFEKIAQEAAIDPATIPAMAAPPPPTQNVGNPGTLPSDGPHVTDSENNTPDLSKGISEFLENLETGNISDTNDLHSLDDLMVTEAELYSIAQDADFAEEDNEFTNPVKPPVSTNTDEILNAALKNVSVDDIIKKLVELDNFYKTREIPRQLAIVDIMLSRLGLASYFTSLSEAINRAYSDNNYISIRIDDILSKLRGSIKPTSTIDLINEPKSPPQAEIAKQNLQKEEDKEDAKEQAKKDLQNQKIQPELKQTPEIVVEEPIEPVIVQPELKVAPKQIITPAV